MYKVERQTRVTAGNNSWYTDDNSNADQHTGPAVEPYAAEVNTVFEKGQEQVQKKTAELLGWLNGLLAPIDLNVNYLRKLSSGVTFLMLACLQGKFFLRVERYFKQTRHG